MSAAQSIGNGVGSTQGPEVVAAGARRRAPLTLRARAIGAVVLVALGIGGAYALGAGQESTDDAELMADVVAVPAQTSGLVAEIAFQDNQRVEQGTVLARIEPSAQKARLAQADAELASAKLAARSADADEAIAAADVHGQRDVATASLGGTRAAARSSDDEIAEAEAEVLAATVAVRQSKQELDRAERLHAEGATRHQDLEAAENAHDGAEAKLAAAMARRSVATSSKVAALSRVVESRARLRQAMTVEPRLERARAQMELAHARVDAAQALRDAAALDLSYTTVVARRSGIVSNRTATAGQMIAAGQTLVNIVATDDVWVIANFKETQVGRMRPGQKAKVAVDAYGGLTLVGEVESLSGGTGAVFSLLPPENATGNFTKVVQRIPVRIRLKSAPADKPLRAGMSAVVTVDVR